MIWCSFTQEGLWNATTEILQIPKPDDPKCAKLSVISGWIEGILLPPFIIVTPAQSQVFVRKKADNSCFWEYYTALRCSMSRSSKRWVWLLDGCASEDVSPHPPLLIAVMKGKRWIKIAKKTNFERKWVL